MMELCVRVGAQMVQNIGCSARRRDTDSAGHYPTTYQCAEELGAYRHETHVDQFDAGPWKSRVEIQIKDGKMVEKRAIVWAVCKGGGLAFCRKSEETGNIHVPLCTVFNNCYRVALTIDRRKWNTTPSTVQSITGTRDVASHHPLGRSPY